MKRILCIGAMLAAPMFAHAQSAELSSTSASCISEGMYGAIAQPNSVRQFLVWSNSKVNLAWTDPAMARYCPNVIARDNAAAQRAYEEAQAEFNTNLRRYGTTP